MNDIPTKVTPLGWQIHPGAYVCDTVVACRNNDRLTGTPAWHALHEWLRFHGIDPFDLPADCLITRLVDERQIVYSRIVRDGEGKQLRDDQHCWVLETVVEQGEAPPLPWPPELYAPNGATS